MILFRVLTLSTLVGLLLAPTAWAAPSDFNGDSVSDRTSVSNTPSLTWYLQNGKELVTIASDFGALGDHIAAADYTGDGIAEPAIITENGRWRALIDGQVQGVNFGTSKATYLAGADIDGDGQADAVYHNRQCNSKKVIARGLTKPFRDGARELKIKGGSGRFFTTYADVDGNGRDDFCWLKPEKKRRNFTGKFMMFCKAFASGKRVARFKVGNVRERPLPVASGNGLDWIALPSIQAKKNRVVVTVRNGNGRRVKKIKFPGTGTILIGNFTNGSGQTEQIALGSEGSMSVYDIASNSFTSVPAPAGILFDQVNINRFGNNGDKCVCNTAKLKKGKKGCPNASSGGGGTVSNGSCDVQRGLSDGPLGWLHKPVSESTGSVVNLFSPGDRPQNCQYERKDGSVFTGAYFSGNTNPNRPTWRPNNVTRCSNFPSPLVVACQVGGRKTCWTVPNPCVRYD